MTTHHGTTASLGRSAAKLLLAAALLAPGMATSLSQRAQAASGAPVIAKVVAIDGKLTLDRPGVGRYAAFVQMPDYLQDRLTTDDKSLAAIELTVGGKIGINKNSAVQLTSATSAVDATTGHVLTVSSGSIWAKFSKQKSTLEIKTPSATLGIRGTEFLVEASKEGTTIEVFEGAVAYAPLGKDGKGSLQGAALATPGMRIFIKNALSAPVVKQYEVDKLRKEAAERNKALADAVVALRMVNEIAGYLPGASGLREVTYQTSLALECVKDPEQAAKSFAASQLESHVPIAGGFLGGLVQSASTQEKKKDPDFITGLAPDKAETSPKSLRFTWNAFKSAQSYALLVSPKEDMGEQDLQWAAQAKTNELSYPVDGPPMAAGQKYFWRVVALDGEGKALGKASQSFFQVPASYKP